PASRPARAVAAPTASAMSSAEPFIDRLTFEPPNRRTAPRTAPDRSTSATSTLEAPPSTARTAGSPPARALPAIRHLVHHHQIEPLVLQPPDDARKGGRGGRGPRVQQDHGVGLR